MKKVMVSFLAGAVMATAATAYGEEAIESLIGKQIQGQTTVYVDGQPLDVALIVDGKSYAPIRSLAEAAGKDVEFGEGEIYLSTPEPETEQPIDDPVAEEPTEEPTDGGEVVPGESSTMSAEEQLRFVTSRLKSKQAVLNVTKGSLEINTNISQEQREATLEDIAKLEAEIAELQAKKAELEAQLAEQK